MADSDGEVPFSFRVSGDLKRAFKTVCARRDRSMSQKLRDFMRAYVREHEGERQHDIQEVLDEMERERL